MYRVAPVYFSNDTQFPKVPYFTDGAILIKTRNIMADGEVTYNPDIFISIKIDGDFCLNKKY